MEKRRTIDIVYLASDLDAAFAITVLLRFSIAEITSKSVWDVGGMSRESPSLFIPTGSHAGNWKASDTQYGIDNSSTSLR